MNRIQPSEIGQMADLLYGLGNLAYRRSGSRQPEVISCLSQSRDLYLQIGDRTSAALAQTALMSRCELLAQTYSSIRL